MGTKLIYYGVLGVVVFASISLTMMMFGDSDPSPEFENAAKTEQSEDSSILSHFFKPKESTRASEEESESLADSIWSEKSLKNNKSKDRFGRNLAEFTEVRDNITQMQKLLNELKIQELESELQRLIKENPKAPEYHAMLGDYYLMRKFYPQAEQSIRNLLMLDPNNDYAKLTLADLVAVQGHPEEGLSLINEVLIDHPEHPTALDGLVELSILKGPEAMTEATETLEDLWREDSNNLSAGALLAETKLRDGSPEDAQRIAEEISNLFPDAPHSYRVKAQLASNQQDQAAWLENSRQWAELETRPRLQEKAQKNLFRALAANRLFDEALEVGRLIGSDDQDIAMTMRMLERQSGQ